MVSKYHAKKTEVDGILFDSQREAERYQELTILERSGMIQDLVLQPRFELLPTYRNGEDVTIRAIHYVADFQYIDCETGRIVIEDVKGVKTEVYKIKKKMFEKYFHPLTIQEV